MPNKKPLAELIREYGRTQDLAGRFCGGGIHHAAKVEWARAEQLYAEIVERLASHNTERDEI